MRIGLLTLELARLSGIDHALAGQARAARALGGSIDVIVVGPAGVSANDELVRFPFRRPARLPVSWAKARLLASVPELDRYDVLFLRYPLSIDLDPLALLRRTRARVATVHHTKEIPELLSGGRSVGLSLRAVLERVQGRRVLRRVAGVVGVTNEIRDYEIARAGKAIAGRTIANGIDVERVTRTGFVAPGAEGLEIVFVASSHAPWHGTDRLLGGLRAYRGSEPVVVHMVGNASGAAAGAEERFGRVTLRHHGVKRGRELDEIFARCSVAISSLAMHRAGLAEGCVLKTREYVARGIPFVLGYEDVDLPANVPFVLRVPPTDSPVDIEAILAFARSFENRTATTASMRAFAESRLDWRVKLGSFVDFAQELAARPAA